MNVRLDPCAALALSLFVSACGSSTRHSRERNAFAELARHDPVGVGSDPDRPPELTDERGHLDRGRLVRAVIDRNPDIAAAREGWRATLAGYRSDSAVGDTMIEYSFAPISIAPDGVPFGQQITVRQEFEGPGKLALRRAVVLAEAEAAEHDFAAMQLELGLMASLLFDRYYAVARSIEINAEHERHLAEIQAAAAAQYEAGRASQRDPLRAELELTNVLRRSVQLRTEREIVEAQLNGLLHRPPHEPLPPPPPALTVADRSDAGASTRDAAAASRPEIRAREAMIAGRQSEIDLAKRAYVPDFGVMASYNTMWEELPHRFMLGLSLSLPLQIGARRAAVRQAEAARREAEARLDAATSRVRVEVEEAEQRWREAGEVLTLYEGRTLPVALAQVEAAQAAYETGGGSFEDLIEAEQALRSAQLETEVARAEASQRYAELERALGRVPGLPTTEASTKEGVVR